MTTEEKFQRLVYVADWTPDAVDCLLKTAVEKGLTTPEQILDYAQRVLDNQCLSQLRGGDPSLDAMVAEAFRNQEFRARKGVQDEPTEGTRPRCRA